MSKKKPGTVELKTPIFHLKQNSEGKVQLEAPDWVIVVPYNPMTGQFLTVVQHRHGIGEETLEFPCGQVEAGEDSLTAGLRELTEETGLTLDGYQEIHQLYVHHTNPAVYTNRMHAYLLLDDRIRAENLRAQKLGDSEKIRVEWVGPYDRAAMRESMTSIFMAHALTQAVEFIMDRHQALKEEDSYECILCRKEQCSTDCPSGSM